MSGEEMFEGDDFEDLVRAIVRDEFKKIEHEKRVTCDHARSGTLDENGDLFCDDCGKLLNDDSGPTPDLGGSR